MVMKRNGYIDFIKFIFALIIAEFHLKAGIFQGGRMAVEGFFILNGYFMARSVEKDKNELSIGRSTVSFMWKKYKSLFYYLFPATIISYIVLLICNEKTLGYAIKRAPMLIFEIVPLYCAGFKGEYVVGVSWYLSAMLIALLILFPLLKKFKQGFVLIACPLIVILGYGTLSHFFKNMAINKQYITDTIINAGVVRALAGCSLGCIMYELSRWASSRKPTVLAKILFTVIEALAFTYFIYGMHHQWLTIYEYAIIPAIFIFMFIGINGLSYTSYLWNPKWTKPLGACSLLIILSHSCWTHYLKKVLGAGYQKTVNVLWYVLAVALTSIAVYFLALALKWICARLGKIKLWKS
jgi:hypothetical protein